MGVVGWDVDGFFGVCWMQGFEVIKKRGSHVFAWICREVVIPG
jgi:predicted RNA binding protein YcfA (HicA-like mRNA interferase family)